MSIRYNIHHTIESKKVCEKYQKEQPPIPVQWRLLIISHCAPSRFKLLRVHNNHHLTTSASNHFTTIKKRKEEKRELYITNLRLEHFI